MIVSSTTIATMYARCLMGFFFFFFKLLNINFIIFDSFKGELEAKNQKAFINIVSTITFLSFPVCRKFWYQIVICSMCFLMIC